MNFDEFLNINKMLYSDAKDAAALTDADLNNVWANSVAIRRFPALSLNNGMAQFINNYDFSEVLSTLKAGNQFTARKTSEPLSNVSAKFIPIMNEGKLLGCQVFFTAETDSEIKVSDINSEKVVAGFTNEYKMPLTVIFSTLGLMARHLEVTGDLITTTYLNLITQNCYKLLRLSNNLMEVSRYRSGIAALNLMQGDLTAFVKGFCEAAGMLIDQIDMDLKCDVPSEPLVTVFDPEKISLVLCNLLSNACKFTRDGNAILIKLEKQGEKAVITVSDKGLGIKSEIIDKIFEPYFSYNSEEGLQGAGLGLSLVKYIVTQHGGTIALQSRENQGTVVAFTLPIKEDETVPPYTSQKGIKYLHDKFSLLNVQMSDICGCPSP